MTIQDAVQTIQQLQRRVAALEHIIGVAEIPLSQRPLPSYMEIAIIRKAVAQEFQVAEFFLLEKTNKPEHVLARSVGWYLARQRGHSLPKIGRAYGGFHRSTVLHGVRKIADQAQGGEIHDRIERIEKRLGEAA
jgi:chromosomal replication initiation ATPase DnaA